jgi:hypothetical protein
MTKEELAAMMAGATYDNFVRSYDLIKQIEAKTGLLIEAEAKNHGLVVVFGASDDLMEFRGAIHDEIGCYNGGDAYVDGAGLLPDRDSIDDDDDALADYFVRKPSAKLIQALWCAEPGYSWTFTANIPHVTFEITEDGEPYCRGIVFALVDAGAQSTGGEG